VKYAWCSTLLLTALVGCSNRNADSQEAVKQGVIRDIAKNVNVAAMDVNVVSVRFRDKEADAVVSFSPKGGSPAQGMTMSYTLARQGSEWHIVKRAQADMQRHAGQGQAQGGPLDAMPPPDSGSQLPPGHPSMNGSPKP
jgi:hypothetical protein